MEVVDLTCLFSIGVERDMGGCHGDEGFSWGCHFGIFVLPLLQKENVDCVTSYALDAVDSY
jgi:hypothetical protein